jgi:spermidine/putrescine ABC transporter ATP-binding subunit
VGNKERKNMLILHNIRKSFGDFVVLNGVSTEIKEGELVTFVGPSGCGKTTLLRIIAGLMQLDEGKIILDGEEIQNNPPNKRDIKMVFQNYALFPHMTVAQNIGYGFRIRKWKKKAIKEKVNNLLSLVKLEGLGDRSIDKLSGGQQQRVALARALSLEPKVLLLDEPLSNLDANLRIVMRGEIRKIQKRVNITTVFVTHDQYEAMSISDRIIVLNNGVIQQIGSPIEIYEHPSNEFIASFVGYVNFLEGKIDIIEKDTGISVVSSELGKIEINLDRSDIKSGDKILLVIRPETVSLSSPDGVIKQNTLEGYVESTMYAGSIIKYVINIGERNLIVEQHNPKDVGLFKEKDKVALMIPKNVHVLRRKSN